MSTLLNLKTSWPDSLASLASSISFTLSKKSETIVVRRLEIPSTLDPWFTKLQQAQEEAEQNSKQREIMLAELEEELFEEERYQDILKYCQYGAYPEGATLLEKRSLR